MTAKITIKPIEKMKTLFSDKFSLLRLLKIYVPPKTDKLIPNTSKQVKTTANQSGELLKTIAATEKAEQSDKIPSIPKLNILNIYAINANPKL